MAPKLHVSDIMQHFTVLDFITVSGVLVVVYCLSKVIYNIYFHPLSKFPGPKLAVISNVSHMRNLVSGRSCFNNKTLHDTYGPIVRIAPNTLSFSSATSWKAIYGHVAARKPFLKSDTYKNEYAPSIVSVRDPHLHGQMRKLLSNGFSQKALMEQEDIVQGYVDLFVKQLSEHATKEEGEEIVKWFNFTTFDVIGDLAFGDPFGSLNDAKPHFWVSLILESIEMFPWVAVFKRYPIVKHLKMFFVPKGAIEARKTHMGYSREKIIKRMNSNVTRKDFLSGMLAKKDAQNISIDELVSQAHVLILAGSETTATFLSAVTYHLCRNPRTYAALTKEIRSSFTNYTDIQGHNTEPLVYLRAVIDEALRMYPPVPVGLPRCSPGETVDGHYIPEGVEVATWGWAATHSEDNFHDPYEFIPERWIDPECKDRKEASQPFSLGSRVCLGRNLALLEMRAILCKMLWTYDMELLDKDLDLDRDSQCFTLWKKPKMHVRFTRRAGIHVPVLDN